MDLTLVYVYFLPNPLLVHILYKMEVEKESEDLSKREKLTLCIVRLQPGTEGAGTAREAASRGCYFISG